MYSKSSWKSPWAQESASNYVSYCASRHIRKFKSYSWTWWGQLLILWLQSICLKQNMLSMFCNKVQRKCDTQQAPCPNSQRLCLHRDSWHLMGSQQGNCTFCSKRMRNNRDNSPLVRDWNIHLKYPDNLFIEINIYLFLFFLSVTMRKYGIVEKWYQANICFVSAII